MITPILAALMAVAPVDTPGCGIYPAAEVLEEIVKPLLTGDDDQWRNLLQLVEQEDSINGALATNEAVCAPLIQHYIDNMGSFTDAQHLVAHGWTYAVMQFGDYEILLVVPRAAEGMVGAPLPHLLFFDRQGQFVSILGVRLP